jgi:septum formation protein
VSAPGGAPLVLASGSPRRSELLARLGVVFVVRAAGIDERPRPGETPGALVARLALEKARAACRPGERALGADTEVALDGEPLGKPHDEAAARAMLARLSGRGHEVWTGVALVERDRSGAARERVGVCRTEIVFRALAGREIADYAASGEPLDRAGAYAIQGGAAEFVERIEGDYENVMGLPLALVRELLAFPEGR